MDEVLTMVQNKKTEIMEETCFPLFRFLFYICLMFQDAHYGHPVF